MIKIFFIEYLVFLDLSAEYIKLTNDLKGTKSSRGQDEKNNKKPKAGK